MRGFGGTDVVLQFAPTSAGSFSNYATFTKSNGGNSTNGLTGSAASVPVASFVGSPTSGLKPLTVNFTDTSSGTITNRFWDWGEGSPTNTSATSLAHTYTVAGTNTVVLTVTGPVGTNTQSRTNYIVGTSPPPQLSLRPTNFDFAPEIIGQSSTQTFQLVNTGGQTLPNSATTTFTFTIAGDTPFSLS